MSKKIFSVLDPEILFRMIISYSVKISGAKRCLLFLKEDNSVPIKLIKGYDKTGYNERNYDGRRNKTIDLQVQRKEVYLRQSQTAEAWMGM